jgi:hypothetical protein
MVMGATEQTVIAGGTPPAGAAQEPPRAPEGGPPGQPGATPPAAPPGAPGGEPEGGDARVVGHGGEIPPERISERVDRGVAAARRKWLLDEYGTDDEATINKIKAERRAAEAARQKEIGELQRYRKAEEERRRAEMTELQRAQTDLEATKLQLEQANATIESLRTDTLASKQDVVVSESLTAHVDQKYLTMVKRELAAHFRGLPEDKQASFDKRALDRWVQGFVKDYPAVAKAVDDPAKPAKPPVRRPISTSREPPMRVAPKPVADNPAAGEVSGKTVRPGQKNTMSKAELNRHYQQATGKKLPW